MYGCPPANPCNRRKRDEEKLERLKKLRDSYYTRLEAVLSPSAVQSYGIGARNVARYNLALKDIQDGIENIENKINELENLMCGIKPRKAVQVIPRDW